jgi:predicted branched-subunit amino acid permease
VSSSPNSEPGQSAAPSWAADATRLDAFLRGYVVLRETPGLVLLASAMGFGALARDSGFDLGHALFLTAIFYALPGQVLLVDQFARGSAILAAAIAVSLTGIRLFPMTVTLIPLVRDDRAPRWLTLVAAHCVAITAWVEGQRRLPVLPKHLRLAHFLGIGSALLCSTATGTTIGYLLAGGGVNVAISAAFLFMTPLYFLTSLIATSSTTSDRLAVGLGLMLGPALFFVVPGFDLLAAGLIGGTIAHRFGRRHR